MYNVERVISSDQREVDMTIQQFTLCTPGHETFAVGRPPIPGKADPGTIVERIERTDGGYFVLHHANGGTTHYPGSTVDYESIVGG